MNFRFVTGVFPALLLLLLSEVEPVDRNKFRTCAQSAFCNRARGMTAGQSQYELEPETVSANANGVQAVVVNNKNDVRFRSVNQTWHDSC